MEDRTKKTHPSSEQGHKKQSQGNTQAPKGANPTRESNNPGKSSTSTQEGRREEGQYNEREERDKGNW